MNELIKIIQADIKANSGNLEVILFLSVFRISSFLKKLVNKGKFWILLVPVYFLSRLLYKLLSIIYLMEMPVGTKIGAGLTIYHLKGTVINADSKIGGNVTINHFITISEGVQIADGVIINPLSVIVKGSIGKNAVIGAGSVVTKNVNENEIVAGCPAKLIGKVI